MSTVPVAWKPLIAMEKVYLFSVDVRLYEIWLTFYFEHASLVRYEVHARILVFEISKVYIVVTKACMYNTQIASKVIRGKLYVNISRLLMRYRF